MKSDKILTLGIPTFNRSNILIKCLDNIIRLNILDKINILIIDNNSDDNTFNLITKKYNNKFDIYKNNENIGFSKNTIKLFEYCKTKYLLWMSDEDFLISANLDSLIATLKNNDIAFLSPQFFLNKKLNRGKKKMINIKENELWE